MGGLRSALRLAATVAAAAAIARAADSARRLLGELDAAAPRHRAATEIAPPEPAWVESPMIPTAPPPLTLVPAVSVSERSTPHAFGPAPSVVPARGIGFRTDTPPRSKQPVGPAAVDELEASGELDDTTAPERGPEPPPPTPIDRLLARRHAAPAGVSARDHPAPAPPRPKSRRPSPAPDLRSLQVEVVDHGRTTISVHADVGPNQVDVVVMVTEHPSGAPAVGRVTVATKAVGATVTVVDGRAAVTLVGAGSSRSIGRKLRVDYSDDDRTDPTSVELRLR